MNTMANDVPIAILCQEHLEWQKLHDSSPLVRFALTPNKDQALDDWANGLPLMGEKHAMYR
jgi:hypothetical protein